MVHSPPLSLMKSPRSPGVLFSGRGARSASVRFVRGLAFATLGLISGPVSAQLFFDLPGLSPTAKSALVLHFDARIGVSVNANGSVTAWEGRDGAGQVRLSATLRGNGDPGNITRSAGNTRIRFTEDDVQDTLFLHADLSELPDVKGGRYTIFWQGFYSGGDPQNNPTLGRYAYNIGIRGPGDASGQARGMSHQRRNAAQNVGVFPGSGQTYLGDSISGFNDQPTVWKTVYDYAGADPYGLHAFRVIDPATGETDLGVEQPGAATVEFTRYPPHLYIGAWNDGVSSASDSGGFSFIGEMGALLIFKGFIGPDDSARIAAYLAGHPQPSGTSTDPVPPEPAGLWEFSSANATLAATIGEDLTVFGTAPTFLPSMTDTRSLLPLTGRGVIRTAAGAGNGLRVPNPIGANGGGSRSNAYTLVFDVMASPERVRRSLFRSGDSVFDSGVYHFSGRGYLPGSDTLGWGNSLGQRESWQRVIITADAEGEGEMRAYINGELAGRHALPGPDSRGSLDAEAFELFHDPEGGNGPLYVDAVALYSRALAPSEIEALAGPNSSLNPAPGNRAPVPSTGTVALPAPVTTGETYALRFHATDPDNDAVQLQVDWGDGRWSAWSGFFPSGGSATFRHAWIHEMELPLRIRARDERGRMTGWVPVGSVTPAAAPTPESDVRLRAIAYNVYGRFAQYSAIHEGAAWLRSQRPDFVAFQELGSLSDAELAELSRAWGHPYAATLGGLGLTSRTPITEVVEHMEGYTRGILEARSGGVRLFVVHKLFGDWRLVEADIARIDPHIRAALAGEDPVLVLGDFNANSRADASYLDSQTTLIESLPSGRIENGAFVYSLMDSFFDMGLVDATTTPAPENSTFPTLLRSTHQPESRQAEVSYRIDYVLTDPDTASRTVIHYPKDPILNRLSDHLPVVADIIRSEEIFPEDYQDWHGEYADLELRHPLADPDRDGVVNLYEYILGGDPAGGGSNGTLLKAESGGIVFTRRVASKQTTEQIIQISRDLEDWDTYTVPGVSTGEFTISDLPERPGYEEVRFLAPGGFTARLFARLKVSGSWIGAHSLVVE